MHRRFLVHSYLLAVFPVLTIWAGNIREVTLTEGVITVLVMCGITAAVKFLLRPLYGNGEKNALAVTFLLLATFSFGFFFSEANLDKFGWMHGAVNWPALVLVPLWATIVVLGLWWIRRWDKDERAYTRMAHIFTGNLLGISILLMGWAVSISPWIWASDRPGLNLTTAEIAVTTDGERRDIYYLVFDRYGDADTLRDDFGFNNGPFLDRLRKRGFHVPDPCFANYPKTELAMASVLNMNYHGEQVLPKLFYRGLLRDHQVGGLLTEAGYRYFHLGNKHTGLRSNKHADDVYCFSAMPSELTNNLFQMTPFYHWFPNKPAPQRSLEKLHSIDRISQLHDGPKFVYAHFMLPHEPWKFGRDGTTLDSRLASQRPETDNYAGQLAFTNNWIEALVDTILANSSRPPIIVIQADEGPELRYENDRAKDAMARIRKRSGILCAMFLPDRDAGEIVPTSFTPVNTFRIIFNEYFAADLELLDDRLYYWDPVNFYGKPELTEACRFIDVTNEIRSFRKEKIVAAVRENYDDT